MSRRTLPRRIRSAKSPVALAIALAAIAAACTLPTPGPKDSRYRYFEPANTGDAWFAKITDWQQRERVGQRTKGSPGLPAGEIFELSDEEAKQATLEQKYRLQSGGERRELAQRFMTWSQVMSREHYKKDSDEAADHWPTSAELLEQGGDDCDGLDLLAFSLLSDFGFPPNELYRAIVRRNRDRANHMVTLWFEDPADPWVVDATGAISLGLRRMSDLDGWTPTRVFNEYEQYAVVEKPNFASAKK